MSSYYTTAELEAMRKARIKKELAESIEKLRTQLKAEHDNPVSVSVERNIVLSVINDDEGVSGYTSRAAIGSAMREIRSEDAREALDFSSLMKSQPMPSSLEKELEALVAQIEERAVITERDALDKERLWTTIAKIQQEQHVDIEDKVQYIGMRVKSYLQGGTPVTQADLERMESERYEYRALCELAGELPREQIPEKVRLEIGRLKGALEKQAQDAYIMETIRAAMQDLGCYTKEDVILDHIPGQLFSVSGHPLCDVFVGADKSGILFEPVAQTRDASLDKKRQIEHSANSICALYAQLEALVLERGVLLKRVYADPVSMETICAQEDVQAQKGKKQQRKARAAKERAAEPEAN